MMTTLATMQDGVSAIKQGAFDYIMKPFELSEIRQAVNNAFEKKSESAQARGEEELAKLSDLSSVLFSTGDASSVILTDKSGSVEHLQP